jgi:hypothetical protein
MGRTRGERRMTNADGDPNLRLVQIVDPVAGYQFVIDPVNKVAHRIKVPISAPSTPRSRAESKPARPSIEEMSFGSYHRDILMIENLGGGPPKIAFEDIGDRVVEGISTRGVRTILDYPAASPTAPAILITTEAWVSDELKIVVLSNRHDSQWGDSRAQLVKASFTEPDENLFRPQPEYTVVDQPGAFSIDITLP